MLLFELIQDGGKKPFLNHQWISTVIQQCSKFPVIRWSMTTQVNFGRPKIIFNSSE